MTEDVAAIVEMLSRIAAKKDACKRTPLEECKRHGRCYFCTHDLTVDEKKLIELLREVVNS